MADRVVQLLAKPCILNYLENYMWGLYCFILDTTSNIAAVTWKDNKTVKVISTFVVKEPQTIIKQSCRKERKKIDVK